MDLKTIVERLQCLEDMAEPLCNKCGRPTTDPHTALLVELRLDIEAYLLRTTGTL